MKIMNNLYFRYMDFVSLFNILVTQKIDMKKPFLWEDV